MNEPRAPFDDAAPEPEPYALDYAYEDPPLVPLAEDSARRRRAGLLGVGALGVFVLFGVVVWLSYGERPTTEPGAEPPLVRAEVAPLKVEPEQTDGAQAPNLDSEVHTALLGGEQPREDVHLLPGPEPLRPPAETSSGTAATDAWLAARDPITEMRLTPDPRANGASEVLVGGATLDPLTPAPEPEPVRELPAAGPAPAPSASSGDVELAALPQDTGAADPEPLAGETVAVDPPNAVDAAPAAIDSPSIVAVIPLAKPQRRTAPAPRQLAAAAAPQDAAFAASTAAPARAAATARSAPSPSGRFRVQLAALGDQVSAERGWVQLRQRHGDVLASYAPLFEPGQTDRGPVVRVQIGPFSDRASASAACEALKRRDAACFVVGG